MVWGDFSFNRTTGIVFLKGKQTSEEYTEMLDCFLLPTAEILVVGIICTNRTMHRFASQDTRTRTHTMVC